VTLVKAPGGIPGDLTAIAGAVPLCDLGPEIDNKIPPAAWVNVTIVPVDVATVQPDAAGRFMHCLFSFAHPRITRGKRRSMVANWAPAFPTKVKAQDQTQVECDPGRFWIGTPCSVAFIGGNKGDKYDVSVEVNIIREIQEPDESWDIFEEPFEFALTSFLVLNPLSPGFPQVPLWHTHFEVVQGAVTVAGQPLTNYGPGGKVPLNAGPIILTASGIYRTTGAI
jgi:hypothetical protein